MDTSPPVRRAVRFGVFEVDLSAGELRKGGVRIKLQEQPFQLLRALLEQPGEVVTREELRERLWPEDTYVDFDRSLNTAASRLREALGDEAGNPRFVETLPRRGYRFIAPVEGGRAEQEAEPTPPAKPGRWGRWVAGAAAVIAVVLVVWRQFPERAGHDSPPLRTIQFTSFPGQELWPAFSPDGNQLAFVWNGESQDNYDIYVQQVRAAGQQRLTSDPAIDSSPAWSPDGQQIAFLRQSDDDPRRLLLMVVPALGGPERKLAETSTWRAEVHQALSWSPTGEYLAVENRVQEGPQSATRGSYRFAQFHLFWPETGERSLLTAGTSPVVSPDGVTLAFLRGEWEAEDIYILGLEGDAKPKGEPRRLTSDEAYIRGLSWTADGRRLVFASNRAGLSTLWGVAVSGGEPERLSVGGDNVSQPSVARRGDRLAYVKEMRTIDIWRTAGPRSETPSSPTPLISSTRTDWVPDYSPDGERIVFTSSRTGDVEIYVCDSDGGNVVRLTRRDGSDADPRWSSDGQGIVFDYRKGPSQDIWTINPDGSDLRQLTRHEAQDARPSWSRDGKWVYFGSYRDGSWQVWKIPSDGGTPLKVTKNGGRQAFESADSKYLYYTKAPQIHGIWRVPVEGGEEVQILDQGEQGSWVLMDEGVLFHHYDGETPAIRFFDFGSGQIKEITKLPRDAQPPLAVSPDGQWLLFAMASVESDIMLVENFR